MKCRSGTDSISSTKVRGADYSISNALTLGPLRSRCRGTTYSLRFRNEAPFASRASMGSPAVKLSARLIGVIALQTGDCSARARIRRRFSATSDVSRMTRCSVAINVRRSTAVRLRLDHTIVPFAVRLGCQILRGMDITQWEPQTIWMELVATRTLIGVIKHSGCGDESRSTTIPVPGLKLHSCV